ncbi:MAG TPA: nuclear transport factor 2 family protein [Acidimicrobiales bacterium]|nr:nuclear transport factor 2 family protein [Acidimicrobiales bacterium]
MTNDEKRDLVERFWATLAARDWDILAGFFDASSEYWDVPIGRETGAIGPANIVTRLKLGLEPLADYTNQPEFTIVEDDHVVTVHSESWTWDDEHRYTLQFSTYQRVVDGVIVEWRDYSDMSGLMAAAPQWWLDRLANDDLAWMSTTPS